MSPDELEIRRTADFAIDSLDIEAWEAADAVTVSTYWSGEAAPAGRHFDVRLLWSDTTLYVRFDAAQAEPLVVSPEPDLAKKTIGLWERDVCEIFVAPDPETPNKYFEFEIAPTGEWIDLGIEVTPQGRSTDWEYRSGMTSFAGTKNGKVVMAIAIPFAALGRTPKGGQVWLGNLFRCVGEGPARGYLAWQATLTEVPAFHVPDAFGSFRFKG